MIWHALEMVGGGVFALLFCAFAWWLGSRGYGAD